MPRAFVCGCLGTSLSAEERAFLRAAEPLGVILFKRNIGTPDEVRALTGAIREALGAEALILIDQEGGRVQRMGPPNWLAYPAAARFSAIGPDLPARAAAIRHVARLMAEDLVAVDIDVDCLPVLDVPTEGAHDVIGDRAYSRDPEAVAMLGRAAAEGLLDAGVLPVMKHVPGHGRAGADSHHALPRVAAPREVLERSDFIPFRANRDLPAAMTAHVVYEAIDPDRPATVSPVVIRDIVRGHIGFDGLLFSDDLSMKALAGTFRQNAQALFAAGVDIALHCNGDRKEAEEVADVAPLVGGMTAARLGWARTAMARARQPFDSVDARRVLDAVLATAV